MSTSTPTNTPDDEPGTGTAGTIPEVEEAQRIADDRPVEDERTPPAPDEDRNP